MFTFPEKIVFILALLTSVYLSWRSFSILVKVINRGQGKLHFDRPASRILEALSVFVLQKTVLTKRPVVSIMHSFLAWAFILYFLVNFGDVLMAFIQHYQFLGDGAIGKAYRLFVDIFSALALIGVAFLLIRRFIFKSQRLIIRDNVNVYENARKGMRVDSMIVGLFIFFHVGFRFISESFHLREIGPDAYQPLASAVAILWTPISANSALIAMHVTWWLAVGLILAFIPYFPSSKHAHLFMGPINYLTKPKRSAYGTLEPINFEDDEVEQFGVANIEHLEKSQILDAYACIMCNRCQDVCPAYVTGKELSPSAYEVSKRYFINDKKVKLAAGEDSELRLLAIGLSESALWACTSCAACVEVCPVGNEPMYDILNIRRDRVLMESQFPKELQGAFNGMERNGNPWNINDDRLNWVKDDESLEVKTVEENPDYEILFWVGCAGAFDQKGQVVARSFARILNHAGVNFAVLGNSESCTGDSARRAGNEYLFAAMAEANVETLNAAKVKKIVATCPHCLHTLKNEYPQFGGEYEVIHHTEFIEGLKRDGKLKLKPAPHNQKVTFHDPCYLGRQNHVFNAPRNNIKMLGYDYIELERAGKDSFCCGAGGAQMWKEEEAGDQPVRQNRMQEIHEKGAEIVGTACPFCLTMMRDAANELEFNVVSKDIAELVAERLE